MDMSIGTFVAIAIGAAVSVVVSFWLTTKKSNKKD